MAGRYEENREFADSLSDTLKRIIHDNIGIIASVKASGHQADKATCTDFVVSTSSGNTIAARVRRPGVMFRDFTLRAKSGSARTELEKIRDGYGDWFLYAWSAESGEIADWLLVDLNRLRLSGLLNQPRQIKDNTDGQTGFVTYTRSELRAADCIAKQMFELRSDSCGYGKHQWADVTEGNRKACRCSKCGALFGYYETPAKPSVLPTLRSFYTEASP